MARLGPPFLNPKICPKKLMWVLFLPRFPGNEAHIIFSGVPKWGVLGGGQKVYVEKVYMLFRSSNDITPCLFTPFLSVPNSRLIGTPGLWGLKHPCKGWAGSQDRV